MTDIRAVEIIPTCVPRNPRELTMSVQKIRSFSHTIHLDIDDGIFTPALTWPYTAPGNFSDVTLQPFAGMDVHVHLMVKSPRDIGVAFSRAGAASVFGHIESFGSTHEVEETLEVWRKSGALEVGLVILIDTPLEVLRPVIQFCDVVQVMSIASIGLQGASFDPRAIERIAELHSRYPEHIIMADGGVSEENISKLMSAGAVRFGIGTAIMKEPDPAVAYARIALAAHAVI